MMRKLLCPGLLESGPVVDRVWALCRGVTNGFIVEGTGGLVCFDAGWGARRTAESLAVLGVDANKVVAVFLTHLHWDHAGAVGAYPRAAICVGEHEKTGIGAAPRWNRVRDGQVVEAAGLQVRVIHTPGHTPGSVCYVADSRLLFSGDTIRLRGGEAVPFAPWLSHDREAHLSSIRALARIDGLTHIFTAHSGATADVAGAFRRWREVAGAPDRGECAP